jgi:hypothetical protein
LALTAFSWLQKGHVNSLSSLGATFLGGGLLDLRLPCVARRAAQRRAPATRRRGGDAAALAAGHTHHFRGRYNSTSLPSAFCIFYYWRWHARDLEKYKKNKLSELDSIFEYQAKQNEKMEKISIMMEIAKFKVKRIRVKKAI